MSNGMKKKRLKISEVEIPDIRITSSWEPDMLEMFRASVKSMGIQEPILVAWDSKHNWLIDGQHRLEEAKQSNQTYIDAVVIESDMKGVHLRNLVLNRLRGKTKASEMVKVIKDLKETHRTGIEEVIQKTGLRREYLEELLQIGEADPEIWNSLDREEIGVGVAFQLSRLPNAEGALKLLAQVKMYSISAKDLKGIVDESLELVKQRQSAPAQPPPNPTTRLKSIQCHICEEEYPVTRMRGMNVCVTCYGIIYDLARRRKAEIEAEKERLAAIAGHKAEAPGHEAEEAASMNHEA